MFLVDPGSILEEDHARCQADIFMLRDFVCDEATNNLECQFDGGDCCLEHKDTSLCQNCDCILAVDQNWLDSQFMDLDIQPLLDSVQFDNVVDENVLTVKDVVSAHGCAMLCLQTDEAEGINAWSYKENLRVCHCSWIESASCPENVVKETNTEVNATDKIQAFVQLAKTIPCSININ